MKQRRRWSMWTVLVLTLAVLLGAMPAGSAEAQARIVYFRQTGHFLRGQFLNFWESRGGLNIFGYPITEEYVRNSDGRLVQYFERARFELDTSGGRATVRLGLIGRDLLAARGVSFPRVPAIPDRNVRYVAETGHNLRGAFRNYWEARGGVAIFGYPLSEEIFETLADGQRLVQYFERARFELVGSTVRLALIGRDLAPCQLLPGRAANNPPTSPLREGDGSTCGQPPPSGGGGTPPPPAPVPGAQVEAVYFPGTGHYLRGVFLNFWRTRGGLDIFGYPITEEYIRNSDRKLVQYFERARFELRQSGNQYIVDLGLIGAESLRARGLGFPPIAPFAGTASRRYFGETGHSIQGLFKSFWESRGSVALFGFPISEEIPELIPGAGQRTVQYFERARFELVGNRVELGLLGRGLAPCQLQPGLPPNQLPPRPLAEGSSKDCDKIPNVVATGRVYPDPAAPGQVLGFEARGYQPKEPVSLWINLPDGKTRAIPYQAIAGADGAVLIGFRTLDSDPEGQYSLVGLGNKSERTVVAPFRLRR